MKIQNAKMTQTVISVQTVIPAHAGIFKTGAFTLPEILIAVSIFSVVATLASSLYIQSFREARRANLQNQIYEDARFIMARIADEVRNGMIDYDEYYNQNVVIPTLVAGVTIPGISDVSPPPPQHFGQNYGRYYSSFFHPGSDLALGFDCNTVVVADGAIGTPARTNKRNLRNCTPLRRTLDRHTGSNPFTGKANTNDENAFCGTVSYSTSEAGIRYGCDAAGTPNPQNPREQNQLYLISADGKQKTILAREKIGADAYALSILRLNGVDTNSDGIADSFVCADEFQCRGNDNVSLVSDPSRATSDCAALGAPDLPGELPRSMTVELLSDIDDNGSFDEDPCDTKSNGFSKDFVPISPLHVNVAELNFSISPDENPHYAFAEGTAQQQQPRVTVVLTVTHPEISQPITLVQTVSSRVLSPIPAPLLVQ